MSGVLTAVLVGASIYSANKQAKAIDNATNQARADALAQEQRALKAEKAGEEAMNKANAKSPNANAILSAAQQAGKGGASGTMLTGPAGVSPDLLQLGKNSLLGQ